MYKGRDFLLTRQIFAKVIQQIVDIFRHNGSKNFKLSGSFGAHPHNLLLSLAYGLLVLLAQHVVVVQRRSVLEALYPSAARTGAQSEVLAEQRGLTDDAVGEALGHDGLLVVGLRVRLRGLPLGKQIADRRHPLELEPQEVVRLVLDYAHNHCVVVVEHQVPVTALDLRENLYRLPQTLVQSPKRVEHIRDC